MRSTNNFVIGLTLLFVSIVEPWAYARPEPVNHHRFNARQAVSPTNTAAVAAAVSASAVAQASALAPICDAASNRNKDTWVAANMGLWFQIQTLPYIENDWEYTPGGSQIQNIQYLMLDWAHDGENPCNNLSVDCNPNPEYSQCLEYPEATFLWFATAAFSNFLGHMATTIGTSSSILTDLTGTMVSQFFTPPSKPTTLIEPISITNGIAAGISTFFPPAAIIAGIGSIANGILTQDGLNEPNPLLQWTDVMAQLGTITNQTLEFLNSYWVTQLGSTPELTNAVTGQSYYQDPTALPAILAPGDFASSTAANLNSANINGLYGALASSGINALWNSDKAFIVKMSDATLGKGTGKACAQYPSMTYCDNGEAYFFIRWVFHESLEAGKTVSSLDNSNWQVWGAYPSAPGNPSGNYDFLDQYGLNLGVIALSSLRVQQAYGFWTNQTAQATIDSVQADITDLSLDRIVSWNMLVCDMDAILNGKHFVQTGTPWYEYIVCTCGNMVDMNGRAWPLPYPSTAALPISACSQVWTG